MGIDIRLAALSDISLLLELRIEFLTTANGVNGDEEIHRLQEENEDFLRKGLADGSFMQWLAFDGAYAVATGSASFYRLPPNKGNPSGHCAYIGNMYTRPAYRRRGVAERILRMALNEAAGRGCGKVNLHATEQGRPLYAKLGFKDAQDGMTYTVSP